MEGCCVCVLLSHVDDLEGVAPETRQQISVNVSKLFKNATCKSLFCKG